jgi:putative FmdB family regulatory protein
VPTYAYACTRCNHRFEVRQSFSDAAVSECPECSGAVRKLFNTVGIVFKGSGFYRTDSRTGNGKVEPGAAKESGLSSTDGSSASKDATGGPGSTGTTGGTGSASKGSGSRGMTAAKGASGSPASPAA